MSGVAKQRKQHLHRMEGTNVMKMINTPNRPAVLAFEKKEVIR